MCWRSSGRSRKRLRGDPRQISQAGHAVTIIYLTRGEAGIPGKSNAEAAAIRTKEADCGFGNLNAKPVFAGQIDGDTIMNNEWLKTVEDLIKQEKPDIVFTHWPLDTHKDHQIASLLTIQTWSKILRNNLICIFLKFAPANRR